MVQPPLPADQLNKIRVIVRVRPLLDDEAKDGEVATQAAMKIK